jgi:hypothetical protein
MSGSDEMRGTSQVASEANSVEVIMSLVDRYATSSRNYGEALARGRDVDAIQEWAQFMASDRLAVVRRLRASEARPAPLSDSPEVP